MKHCQTLLGTLLIVLTLANCAKEEKQKGLRSVKVSPPAEGSASDAAKTPPAPKSDKVSTGGAAEENNADATGKTEDQAGGAAGAPNPTPAPAAAEEAVNARASQNVVLTSQSVADARKSAVSLLRLTEADAKTLADLQTAPGSKAKGLWQFRKDTLNRADLAVIASPIKNESLEKDLAEVTALSANTNYIQLGCTDSQLDGLGSSEKISDLKRQDAYDLIAKGFTSTKAVELKAKKVVLCGIDEELVLPYFPLGLRLVADEVILLDAHMRLRGLGSFTILTNQLTVQEINQIILNPPGKNEKAASNMGLELKVLKVNADPEKLDTLVIGVVR